MNLRKYDGKCIRITDRWGDVFEGLACHDSADYCMHEFGVEEEALEMSQFLLYKSQITKIEDLTKCKGSFGCFSEPYGKLEQTIMQDGADIIEEVLSCEEPISILRMMCCLKQEYDPAAVDAAERERVFKALRELILLTDDDEVRSAAAQLLKAWGQDAGN